MLGRGRDGIGPRGEQERTTALDKLTPYVGCSIITPNRSAQTGAAFSRLAGFGRHTVMLLRMEDMTMTACKCISKKH